MINNCSKKTTIKPKIIQSVFTNFNGKHFIGKVRCSNEKNVMKVFLGEKKLTS